MRNLFKYIFCILPLFVISCSDDDNQVVNEEEQTLPYVPFEINKGVNVSGWLSQSDANNSDRTNFFTQEDVNSLASEGFDHIRLPIDEEDMFTEDGEKIDENFTLLHNAIDWCENASMKVIVDMHTVRSQDFSKAPSAETISSFYDTFEDGSIGSWFPTKNDVVTLSVVDNPEKDDVNSSDKVLLINKTNDGNDWPAGKRKDFELPVGPNDMQFKYLRMKFRKDKVSTMTVILTDQDGKEYYTGYQNSAANDWEEIAIEVQGKMDGTCTRVTLRPDNVEGKLYVDDIYFSDSDEGTNKDLVSDVDDYVPELWTDKEAQFKLLDLWKTLADDLKDYSTSSVAFELLNEPVATYDSQWNALSLLLINEIRANDPDRKIVLGSNLYESINTFNQLTVPEDDHNIILSFHFYEPFLFTHYQAEWTALKNLNVTVHYPGEIISPEDYDALSDADKSIVDNYMGSYDKTTLESRIALAVSKAKELGLQLYCGEFGCYKKSPSADRLAWIEDMTSILQDQNIAYSYWEYKQGFGFSDSESNIIEQNVIDILTK
ncbi:MAG: cellulase family glycosylhydrolase [Bacteroidales bacterium]